MVERKCLHCGTWNNNERYCKSCGAPVHPDEIAQLEYKKRQEEIANAPKDKFDLFAERLKEHQNPLVRFLYKVGYSISIVFGAIGAFFAWMVALANG